MYDPAAKIRNITAEMTSVRPKRAGAVLLFGALP
uniref:Uncharacterized protein n=1 Tax=Siphoviridae sp. ctg0K17 TaxID=2825600 RepID=A0A8S5PWU6_9CAUD|nr:MAG TPA: hypothetical protein [Siphoviridae sp. ctg0K17]